MDYCKKNHPLAWSVSPMGYMGGMYACDVCHKSYPCATGRFSCYPCKFDICQMCKQQMQMHVPAPMPGPMQFMSCKMGHQLTWNNSNAGYMGFNFSCDNCRTNHNCAEGRWNCMSCKYDICSRCRPPMPAPFVPTQPSTTNCSKNHPLQWSTESYSMGMYSCNLCKRSNQCHLGRWFCKACQYDICPQCRPQPPMPAPMPGPSMTAYIQCKNMHPLQWTNSTAGYMMGKYSCDVCHKSNDCGYGRWSCPGCKYDVCPSCRPSQPMPGPMPAPMPAPMPGPMPGPGAHITHCKNGHPLEWTHDVSGYMMGRYSCDVCHKSSDCGAGRHYCRTCKYDVCQNCKPQYGSAPPMPMGVTMNMPGMSVSMGMPGAPVTTGPAPMGSMGMSMGMGTGAPGMASFSVGMPGMNVSMGMPGMSVGMGMSGPYQPAPGPMMPPQPQYQAQFQPAPMPGPMPGPTFSSSLPSLPNNGGATPTICVGGYNPSATGFNDYTSFAMDALRNGNRIVVDDIEIWTNKEKNKIVFMDIQYNMPNFNGGSFSENVKKEHGKKPSSIMLPHDRVHMFSDEWITNITGRHNGSEITKICIHVNNGKTLTMGSDIGMEFNLMVPTGKRVVAFATQFSDHMHNLGVYYV